ncbi:Glycosyl hydrolases family 2, TIM barrel domain [Filimonas lacunae]|uniref:Glycosyl hydrolases family 2, TIM barrel domain n=1 Tax=Filimonas lacunae TaxID=477680 RepID=A0A173MN29_9BACT|nr:glycoside hydrolase family 2 TIM barrel-domain containing protein [Filimonas lacunae]BAV08788.1 beta-mannosidase [Filimonas lacunae]SIS61738.1 Glycosyl hydrolases family 2, TIM barrel domain [Filimonas lacunae]
MKSKLLIVLGGLLVLCSRPLTAQQLYELSDGWKCAPVSSVKESGAVISGTAYALNSWQTAVVPGTVLTTQLLHKQVPDPFYGMNNQLIPDIHNTGRDYYTYWFVKDVEEAYPAAGQQVWLQLRGVNYGCDVYYNSHKLNRVTHKGMFLRQEYNITQWMQKNGHNRLAVIVYPPDETGNANGGQGGDGTIAKNVSHQYVAGWDWIQPIRDRNTGIWDKVFIKKTGGVVVRHPHIITEVPGVRIPTGVQQPAIIKVSAELQNTTAATLTGTLQYVLDGHKISEQVILAPGATKQVQLPRLVLDNPRLWWPNNYGSQPLYTLPLQFVVNGKGVSDADSVSFGIREIQTSWNTTTGSKEIAVNGQKVFIKGGNWIISDAMLRFSPERYDAEVRYHRDMNLNLIRVWGGALTERPEFYNACDKYGMLVMQDFWTSGDCNGKWVDPLKKEDQWTRRKYPDDHPLFIVSAADQIKMIRNHPSLAIWCGGNEITLAEDIHHALKDSLMPMLDGTRWFVDYSNSDSMSYNRLGGNGDGPYGLQDIKTFWGTQTWPFNSEVGSVGVGDYESLQRFIPAANLKAPVYKADGSAIVDSVWDYHKYIGYDSSVEAYGKVMDAADFARKAQLVNYNQYRGLIEGFSSHQWEWYSGVIIWKTQNPWTAMRGQMYDYYLDPNACLFGLRNAGEPLHIMFNPMDSMVMLCNNTFTAQRDVMMVAKLYDKAGKETFITQVFTEAPANRARRYFGVGEALVKAAKKDGAFLSLQLLDKQQQVISDNLYWLPGADGKYTMLQQLPVASLTTQCRRVRAGEVEVTLQNAANGAVAFFNRISLLDASSKQRILPAFYSDNYVSVLPGQQKTITISYTGAISNLAVMVTGWNSKETFNTIANEK